MRYKETTPIFLSRWSHCVWFFNLVVCNVSGPGETVWIWHWFGTFVNCWTSQEDNKEYAVHALPALHLVCLPWVTPNIRCKIPLLHGFPLMLFFFLMCTYAFLSQIAKEEKCVSMLQCSCECMQVVISLQVQFCTEKIMILGSMFLAPQDSPEKSSNF